MLMIVVACSGSARKALPTEAGGVPVSSAKRNKVGSCARMNCSTPARKPGSRAASPDRMCLDAGDRQEARQQFRIGGDEAECVDGDRLGLLAH